MRISDRLPAGVHPGNYILIAGTCYFLIGGKLYCADVQPDDDIAWEDSTEVLPGVIDGHYQPIADFALSALVEADRLVKLLG